MEINFFLLVCCICFVLFMLVEFWGYCVNIGLLVVKMVWFYMVFYLISKFVVVVYIF